MNDLLNKNLRQVSNSLSSTKWSSGLEVVCDISCLGLCIKVEIILLSHLSLNLNMDVLEVIKAQRFSLINVEIFGSLGNNFLHSFLLFLFSLLMSLTVINSQSLVVYIVSIQLNWMLVVSKESVVSICKISQCSSLYRLSTIN